MNIYGVFSRRCGTGYLTDLIINKNKQMKKSSTYYFLSGFGIGIIAILIVMLKELLWMQAGFSEFLKSFFAAPHNLLLLLIPIGSAILLFMLKKSSATGYWARR